MGELWRPKSTSVTSLYASYRALGHSGTSTCRCDSHSMNPPALSLLGPCKSPFLLLQVRFLGKFKCFTVGMNLCSSSLFVLSEAPGKIYFKIWHPATDDQGKSAGSLGPERNQKSVKPCLLQKKLRRWRVYGVIVELWRERAQQTRKKAERTHSVERGLEVVSGRKWGRHEHVFTAWERFGVKF